MLIKCDFSADYCKWQVGATDEASGFVFVRTNSQQLNQDDIQGPESAHSGLEDDFFVFVTTKDTKDEPGYATTLESPYLIGSQHQEECMEFWFEYPNFPGINNVALILREKDSDDAQLIWELDHQRWNGEKWNQGRVFFKAKSNTDNYEYRLEFVAARGQGQDGYFALDDVLFYADYDQATCTTEPKEAKPVEPTNPPTTIVTEPPNNLITCDFQNGFCNWKYDCTIENCNYVFERRTSDDLKQNNITGPTSDKFGLTDKYFLLTSNYKAQEVLAGSTTTLISPLFAAKDHPVECFFFFFYLDVSHDHLIFKLVSNIDSTSFRAKVKVKP